MQAYIISAHYSIQSSVLIADSKWKWSSVWSILHWERCGESFKYVILQHIRMIEIWFQLKLPSVESHRVSLMISQHWFRYSTKQAITSTDVSQILCHHMASLGASLNLVLYLTFQCMGSLSVYKQDVLSIHWKLCISYIHDIWRAHRFKNLNAFLKRSRELKNNMFTGIVIMTFKKCIIFGPIKIFISFKLL